MHWFLDSTKEILEFLKTVGGWIASGIAAVGLGVIAVFTLLRERNKKLEEKLDKIQKENNELKARLVEVEKKTDRVTKKVNDKSEEGEIGEV